MPTWFVKRYDGRVNSSGKAAEVSVGEDDKVGKSVDGDNGLQPTNF